MNTEEFEVWRQDFIGRNAKTVESIAKAANSLQVSVTAVFAAWREALAEYELADAMQASQEYQYHIREFPPRYDDIPAALRHACQDICTNRLLSPPSTTEGDGHNPKWCGACRNQGHVLIEDDNRTLNAWACRCPAGDHWLRTRKPRSKTIRDYLPRCPDDVWQRFVDERSRLQEAAAADPPINVPLDRSRMFKGVSSQSY